MGYQLVLDVGIVDFAIKCAIRELSNHQATISALDIANHIGCSDSTVRRSLPRLIESGSVLRYGSKRNGYRYEIPEDHRANSA